MKKRLLLVVLIFVLALAMPIWADVVIEESVAAGNGSAPQTARMYLTTNRLALTQGSGGMIFLADKQILWQYDTDQHLYLEFTPETMKGLKAQTDAMVGKAVEAMKQQMENAPADQKAALQKAIDQMQKGSTYSFRRLGPDRVGGGYRCTPIEVLMDGESQSQVCVARLSELGLSSADMHVFDELSKFYAHLGNDTNAGSFDLPGIKKFLGYEAFPVEEKSAGADGTSVTTLKSVKHQAVPASLFDLPPGLAKQDLFGGQ